VNFTLKSECHSKNEIWVNLFQNWLNFHFLERFKELERNFRKQCKGYAKSPKESTGQEMSPANKIFPPLASSLHQQHRLERWFVALYTIIANSNIVLLPIARKPQRRKTQIHIIQSILAVLLCHPIKLPLRSYNILQLRHCLQQPSRYMQQSLQNIIIFNICFSWLIIDLAIFYCISLVKF